MTISDWLMLNMQRLGKAGVDSPRRDCLVIIEDTLDKDRSWVLAHSDHNIELNDLAKLSSLIERRVSREPLAYIRGKAWFYGRFFEVNTNVLIPRPESEDFIEQLKNIRSKQIIDIGTGSGCLGITAKIELPNLDVIATDIEAAALKVAQKNAKNHKVNIKFVQSNLFDSISEYVHNKTTIIANLPYVPQSMITSPEIEQEPSSALFSGKDGLDHYRKFWQQVSDLKTKPTCILVESLKNQHEEMNKLAQAAGYKSIQATSRSLVQVFML